MDFDDPGEPLFAISTVARMIAVHPQTLRLYERMGFVEPGRTKGKKRMYSLRNIHQLQFIQGLTRDRGVNLAGVKMILKLQEQVDHLQREMRETLKDLMERTEKGPKGSHVLLKGFSRGGSRIKIERG